jgi:WD40 repeat protein
MARACDFSPDGNYLAVGFGGRVGKASAGGVDGQVKIFRFDRPAQGKNTPFALTQVGELKDAKQWISCVRFSPDGCTLAVGSRDNSIYFTACCISTRRRASSASTTPASTSWTSRRTGSTCRATAGELTVLLILPAAEEVLRVIFCCSEWDSHLYRQSRCNTNQRLP